MVPFESLGTIFYSRFIATMAVSLAYARIVRKIIHIRHKMLERERERERVKLCLSTRAPLYRCGARNVITSVCVCLSVCPQHNSRCMSTKLHVRHGQGVTLYKRLKLLNVGIIYIFIHQKK